MQVGNKDAVFDYGRGFSFDPFVIKGQVADRVTGDGFATRVGHGHQIGGDGGADLALGHGARLHKVSLNRMADGLMA